MNEPEQQTISDIKGRPMLHWYGKKPLQSIEYFPAQEKEVYGDPQAEEFNKLFWGDNLQVLSHLLKEYRGKIDLIYIDPPFDSKADYVKKVKIRGQKIEGQQQSLLEETQYTDIWENDEYLQFMYERLQIMRELLAETGSIYVHVDYRRIAQIRLIMDEVFGNENLINEIIWFYKTGGLPEKIGFGKKHDTLLFYGKDKNSTVWNAQKEKSYLTHNYGFSNIKIYEDDKGKFTRVHMRDVWDISGLRGNQPEKVDYPTQKPEGLLKRVIKASSNEGDIVMDCFAGSGTTLAVAQKLGRRWIGCDINLGAIQTTTKRLNQIIQEQQESDSGDFTGLYSFKVYNVNEYDVFKNEIEAKDIIMDMYGIEPIKRSYFDGVLDNNYVKVMPLNRILNKHDIAQVINSIQETIDTFTVKESSKADEDTYKEGVIVIGSGAEGDLYDFVKKENTTGVSIQIRDIQTDKKSLIFKQPTEADITVSTEGKKITITINDFFSPLLMQKLNLENEKRLKKDDEAVVEDFKQIIDSVCIDCNYNGELFNADIMDLPDKKETISGTYECEVDKKGSKTIAVKIIDVLGEEYFETFEIAS